MSNPITNFSVKKTKIFINGLDYLFRTVCQVQGISDEGKWVGGILDFTEMFFQVLQSEFIFHSIRFLQQSDEHVSS